MALVGRFHHMDIKVTFTLKTTLRVLELFLGLLPIFRDSRETQTMPDPPPPPPQQRERRITTTLKYSEKLTSNSYQKGGSLADVLSSSLELRSMRSLRDSGMVRSTSSRRLGSVRRVSRCVDKKVQRNVNNV